MFSRKGVTGEIAINGQSSVGLNVDRKQCSYILQDDNLYANFSVRETMTLAVNLKIAGKSELDKSKLVSNAASAMKNN